jgi:tetratricopeptide (TPR) repeat protein
MSPDVARQTTTSLEAYRAYLDGVRLLNGWRLTEAEAALKRATDADSTFALAYYKRALAIGWRRATDSSQLVAMQHAMRHADRLSPRQRELIQAYDAIVKGLSGATTEEVTRNLAEAQRRYEALVRKDSTDAEAWYGLGDAYYHGVPLADSTSPYWTRALRAFDRTTQLDSSFHLAYAHKVNIYQSASQRNTGVLVEGDSVIVLRGRAAVDSFGRERHERAIASARQRLIAEARHWVDADPDAPQAWFYLAGSYVATGHPDTAALTLRQAEQRTSGLLPDQYFQRAVWEAMAEDTAARSTLRSALERFTADSITARGSAARVGAVGGAVGVAALFGDLRMMDTTIALTAEIAPPPRQMSRVTLRQAFGLLGTTLRAAAGADLDRARREIDVALGHIEREPDPVGRDIRGQVIQVPYVAYLVWRDPKYLDMLQRFSRDTTDTFPELRALAALRSGDTALARRLSTQMVRVDSMSGISFAGMRVVARAEVLEELGDTSGALRYYESILPRRFTQNSIAEPGWPLLARSYPARARLYEATGERDKAIASYERFLTLWGEADPALQPQVQAARRELARLRDAARTQPVR